MGLGEFKRYKSPLTGVVLGTVIGLAVAYGLAIVMPWRPPPKKPDFAAAGDPPKMMFKAPDFTGFVNQRGQSVSAKDFSGKVLVVTFMYPYCTRTCPVLASRMVNLETLLRQRHVQDDVQLLSFNVDPEDSSPALMGRFMAQYGANPDDGTWQFLMAPSAQTEQIVKQGFHATYEKVSVSQLESIFAQQRAKGAYRYMPVMRNPLADAAKPDYAVLHTSSMIIVGPDGVVRYVLGEAGSVSAAVMVNDIIRVLRSGKPS